MEDRGSRIETSRRWPERCPVGVTDGKRVGREEQAGCPVFWRKGYPTKAGATDRNAISTAAASALKGSTHPDMDGPVK